MPVRDKVADLALAYLLHGNPVFTVIQQRILTDSQFCRTYATHHQGNWTGLQLAHSFGWRLLVERVLSLSADAETDSALTAAGRFPSTLSSQHSHSSVTQMLLDYKVDPICFDPYTSLEHLESPNLECLYPMMFHHELNFIVGYAALIRTSRNVHAGVVKLLLPGCGNSLLHIQTFRLTIPGEHKVVVEVFLLHCGLAPDAFKPSRTWRRTAVVARKPMEGSPALLHEESLGPSSPYKSGLTLLHGLAICGSGEMLRLLLPFRSIDTDPSHRLKRAPLWYAAARGDQRTVFLLLARNADPNEQDRRGQTPLYAAACRGHEEAVKLFLKKQGNPNLPGDLRYTPLLAAARLGHKGIVRSLWMTTTLT
jgi:hypothetical protein